MIMVLLNVIVVVIVVLNVNLVVVIVMGVVTLIKRQVAVLPVNSVAFP